MGENLALNMADHGYRVAVYNRTTAVMEKFVAGHADTPGGLVGAPSLPDFVAALKKPRKILILVKAGPPVDAVVEQLLGAGVEPEDIVVDCGNSLWTDTIRREKQYADRCRFFGSGVSGGEVGARFGPSLMPGGHPASWEKITEAYRRDPGLVNLMLDPYFKESARLAITSAPTHTSAWTRRVRSSSTWTGQTPSARSGPSDRRLVVTALTCFRRLSAIQA
jgi:6-phosphogluconate dehydrogenase